MYQNRFGWSKQSHWLIFEYLNMSNLHQLQKEKNKLEKEEVQKINAKLIDSGERNKLKENLRQYLLESGWYEDIRIYVKGNFKKV
jgi:uncharacterized protein YeeX (DUF496 family)